MPDIVNAISNLGFPIAMCVLCCYYIKYSDDKHREEREKDRQLHREEMNGVTQALQNNTVALTKICTLIEQGKEE